MVSQPGAQQASKRPNKLNWDQRVILYGRAHALTENSPNMDPGKWTETDTWEKYTIATPIQFFHAYLQPRLISKLTTWHTEKSLHQKIYIQDDSL